MLLFSSPDLWSNRETLHSLVRTDACVDVLRML